MHTILNRINRALSRASLPLTLKLISLAAYILLIVAGLSAYSTDQVFLRQLRNTNAGNLIVWSYWWPAIVVASIFFGRLWCMVCPVEVITTFFARIGLQRKRPKWLLSGWVITAFYIFILFVGIQGYSIHRNPFYMAVYLLSIAGVSILVGTIYEKNTFCRYVCPVGYLLGLYSKLSFFGWRVKDPETCRTCRDKSCISKEYRYLLNSKSCGVDLYPARIDDNAHCILCAGCLKTCNRFSSASEPGRPNPHWMYIGFAHDLFALKPLKIAELVFVIVVSGFVVSEIWSEWSVTDTYVLIPAYLQSEHGITNKVLLTLCTNLLLFVVFPLIIWLIPLIIARFLGSAIRIKNYFLTYGIAFIPIIAAAHLSKSLLKTTSRIPYFEHLFYDLTGITTAENILSGRYTLQTNPAWMNQTVSLMITTFMTAGIWLSIKVISKLNTRISKAGPTSQFYLIPVIYGLIYLFMIIFWRWF